MDEFQEGEENNLNDYNEFNDENDENYYERVSILFLADEILASIFIFLSHKDICKGIQLVNHSWNEISNKPIIWKHLCNQSQLLNADKVQKVKKERIIKKQNQQIPLIVKNNSNNNENLDDSLPVNPDFYAQNFSNPLKSINNKLNSEINNTGINLKEDLDVPWKLVFSGKFKNIRKKQIQRILNWVCEIYYLCEFIQSISNKIISKLLFFFL